MQRSEKILTTPDAWPLSVLNASLDPSGSWLWSVHVSHCELLLALGVHSDACCPLHLEPVWSCPCQHLSQMVDCVISSKTSFDKCACSFWITCFLLWNTKRDIYRFLVYTVGVNSHQNCLSTNIFQDISTCSHRKTLLYKVAISYEFVRCQSYETYDF